MNIKQFLTLEYNPSKYFPFKPIIFGNGIVRNKVCIAIFYMKHRPNIFSSSNY